MEIVFELSERRNEVLILDGGKFRFTKVLKNNERFGVAVLKHVKPKCGQWDRKRLYPGVNYNTITQRTPN